MPSTESQPHIMRHAPEKNFAAALRRYFPAFCLLVAAVVLAQTLFDPFQLDGDGVNYLDLAGYLRAHQWAAIVNGYWHPMYPAFLALGQMLFRATLATELRAAYFMNFGIFLLQMLAVCCFTGALVNLRNAQSQARDEFLLGRYALRYLALALLVIAAQRELSPGKVRPDALLQAFLLFAFAALLTHVRTARLRDAALMGLALGCAYLTKSFGFVVALLFVLALILSRFLWMRHSGRRIVSSAAVALVCFGAVAGPYIAALSRQHGRFDFGDSGSLNYAWYVAGTEKMHLQPYMTSLFGSSEVSLKHPERELMRSPQVLSYAALPYGTYPDWFDPTYWNDHITPHFNLRGELSRGARNCVLVVRYLFNHPEPLLLLAVLLALGATPALAWRPRATGTFWLAPTALGLLIWAIYATVNTEERYVTLAFLSLVLTFFAILRPPARLELRTSKVAACALIVLLALLATGETLRIALENRRDLSQLGLARSWQSPQQQSAAEALVSMGLEPGDTVACVGSTACLNDYYWARLAQVRIVSEIYDRDAVPAFDYLRLLPNRDAAIAAVRSTGAKVLVADFDGARVTPADPAMQQWRRLGDSTLYELPLNLPPGTVPREKPPAPHHRPSI